MNLDYSFIIPTHNRAASLLRCLESIRAANFDGEYEVIVVANNCSDNTKSVCSNFPEVRYVEESRTAFSRARRTGYEESRGEILIFVDDDTKVWAESLTTLSKIFSEVATCGIVAGRIEPEFEVEPPQWATIAQVKLNAWSLFAPKMPNARPDSTMEVDSACGPFMAIRRSVYELVGGFPPDTIGVETNSGQGQFSKWYVGPGDYGLSTLVKRAGFSILYSPMAGVDHVIPELRTHQDFWISRYYGEGFYLATSDLRFWHRSRIWLLGSMFLKLIFTIAFLTREKFQASKSVIPRPPEPYQFRAIENITYIFSAAHHLFHPNLSKLLWDMAENGVSDAAYNDTISKVPKTFLTIQPSPKGSSFESGNLAWETLKYLLKKTRSCLS